MGKVSEDVVNPSVGADPPRSRGGSDPSPGGRLSTHPARGVGHRRQFFRRGHRGLMCGAGVAQTWCRGGSGGARDSQLFFGYILTGIFSKIHLDIATMTTTTTTEEHYIIRISRITLILHGNEFHSLTFRGHPRERPRVAGCSIANACERPRAPTRTTVGTHAHDRGGHPQKRRKM